MDSSEAQVSKKDSDSTPRQVSWEEVSDMMQFVGGLCEFREGTAQFRANVTSVSVENGRVYIALRHCKMLGDDGDWMAHPLDEIEFSLELCDAATMIGGELEFRTMFTGHVLGVHKITPAAFPRRIIVTKRSDDIHAEAEGTSCWGCGKTTAHAIGDLMMSHGELFNIVIHMSEGTFKEEKTEVPEDSSPKQVH